MLPDVHSYIGMFQQKTGRIRGVMYLAVYLGIYGTGATVYSVYGNIKPSKRHEGGFVFKISVYTV
jgi:hypothetical protein